MGSPTLRPGKTGLAPCHGITLARRRHHKATSGDMSQDEAGRVPILGPSPAHDSHRRYAVVTAQPDGSLAAEVFEGCQLAQTANPRPNLKGGHKALLAVPMPHGEPSDPDVRSHPEAAHGRLRHIRQQLQVIGTL